MKPNEPADHARLEELLLESRTRALSTDERAELNAILRSHADARAHAAQFLVDEAALTEVLREAEVAHLFRDDGASVAAVRQSLDATRPRPVRTLWKPLANLAAGLVLGLFSATLVWGYVVPRSGAVKRVTIPVADASFEHADAGLEAGFPTAAGKWSADAARVVSGEAGVSPRDGAAMLRLEPTDRHYSRLVQVLDLAALGSDARAAGEVEVSAAFHSATSVASRYKVRVFGFDESARDLKPFPLETPDEGVISATRLLDVGGEPGWNTVTVRMPLPPTVRTLVIWIGAGTRGPGAPKSTHFVDDIRAALLVRADETKP